VRRSLVRLLMGSMVGLLAVLLIPEAAFAIDEFPGLAEAMEPVGIAAGPSGGVWLCVSRITTGGGIIEVRIPIVESQPVCTISNQHNASIERAKQLKRAGCQHWVRGRGSVPWTSPKAGIHKSKVAQIDCRRTRGKVKRAVLERLMTVKGGLEQ
jgi:hypothetical protein